ncbi:MAG: hypothetical protein AABX85_00380 [Nanoarchaeota archaeon]
MDKSQFRHLREFSGLESSSNPELPIVERAEVTCVDGSKYLLYVIGLRLYGNGAWDIIHSVSSKDERGNKGLKFCPLEGLVSYLVLTPPIQSKLPINS